MYINYCYSQTRKNEENGNDFLTHTSSHSKCFDDFNATKNTYFLKPQQQIYIFKTWPFVIYFANDSNLNEKKYEAYTIIFVSTKFRFTGITRWACCWKRTLFKMWVCHFSSGYGLGQKWSYVNRMNESETWDKCLLFSTWYQRPSLRASGAVCARVQC